MLPLSWIRRTAPPAADSPPADAEFAVQVRNVLAEFQPYLKADGGSAELVSIKANGEVHVRLRGACAGCPQRSITFDLTLEQRLREVAPKFRRLVYVGC